MLEDMSVELAANRKRLSDVVQRYKKLCLRAREIEEGRRRVALVLVRTLERLGVEELDGLTRDELVASLPCRPA